LIQEYGALMNRLAPALLDDCSQSRPVAGAYSPYGVIYGFSSDLIGHMVFTALLPASATPFGFEDVFTDGDADKLAWVSGWRKLPHLNPEVAKQFDYPQRFAEDIFDRIERTLRKHADPQSNGKLQSGRMLIVPAADRQVAASTPPITDVPLAYIGSSDV
jgi:hypothetical protein